MSLPKSPAHRAQFEANRRRVAAGVPTGGQFAATTRAESTVNLLDLDDMDSDNAFNNDFLSDGEIAGLQDGTLVLAEPKKCRDCNGTGESCRACRGRGHSSVQRAVPVPLPVHTEEGQNLLAPMGDAQFANYLSRSLGLFKEGNAARVSIGALDAAVVRDELRARRATEIPGLDGYDERTALYERATEQLFACAPADLGEPQDAVEATGYVKSGRFRTRLSRDHDAGSEAALRIAETDPGLAQAVIVRLNSEKGELQWHDAYRPEHDPLPQTILRFAASPEPEVRVLAATHARGDSPALDVLAKDPHVDVRVAVAKRAQDIYLRRSVPQVQRSRFSIDLDHYERQWVKDGAVHRDKAGRATVEMLEGLATDPDTDVRRQMAQAKHFPSMRAAKALAGDEDPMVRHLLVTGIADKDVHPDVLDILSRDPEQGIRENLAASGVTLPPKAAARLGVHAASVPADVPTEFAVVDGQIVRRPAAPEPPRVARRRAR